MPHPSLWSQNLFGGSVIFQLTFAFQHLEPFAKDMQFFYHAIVLVVVAFQASAASNSASTSDLNGWYPCSVYTFSDEGSSTGEVAECAVYKAPLCYPGICEAPKDVDSKVDIFVKRMPATVGNPDTAPNVWLLAGGPGDSSTYSTCFKNGRC
ncbi:hypothetical protein GN958_ATG03990 [Phytophthora infestans]|uniref:Uncharacterized protein n=1 Tax=Phytophthora infestans TaxID=4787 RepID=A0A8S9TWX0_PHYIN|nr:hypothetical protein GN958_ATG19491 [Phytophthora infestans]KAF4146853.1 hypothetical protein GN958_ATG03990 [Phytophthora infestans]